jgi:hypothetical protein
MGIPFPRVGGSFTLEELEAIARDLHESAQAPSTEPADPLTQLPAEAAD